MSAPTDEKPATEKPTEPLPIAGTRDLPPRHSDFMESGLWLFPGGPIAAAVVGIPLHELWVYTDDAMFTFAVVVLVGAFAAAALAFLIPHTIGRGKDGRS